LTANIRYELKNDPLDELVRHIAQRDVLGPLVQRQPVLEVVRT
jgi:hypothetical protein